MIRATLLGVCAMGAMALPAQTFDAPERIKAGDTFAGETLDGRDRLYPSPGMHDVDGDGKLDIVIGDLRGYLTVTKRTADGWSAEENLLGADGKPLKFNNW
jgi:hypothetical protein